ncbi:MAG: S8 family peptidase [Methanosarcinales archaeon]|nr:S8 family peptidase [Methanosarcinales archaeon]
MDRSGNVARKTAGGIMVLDPWDLNANGIEDSLEKLGAEETRVIVLHDNNATIGLNALGSDQRPLSLMTGSSMVIQGDKIADLSRLNGVKGIYRDQKLKVLAEPGEASPAPRRAAQSRGDLDGRGVTVALLDTGADAGHLSLDDMDDDPSTDDPKIIAFQDFVNGQTATYDDQGHGTHCASLIAGTRGIGVAPGARLVVVKVMDRDGACYLSDAMTALEGCQENRERYGINIISFSVGGETPVDGTSLLDEACNRMVDEGLVVVVAAGNSGPGPQSIVIPGSAKNVITVGAIDEEGEIFDRSSRGPTLDGRIKPDLVTLGVDVSSALAGSVDQESTMTGTSMAVPQVSGAAAVLFQATSDLTPADVKRILVSTTDDLGTPGPDNAFGNGALNLSRSLSLIQYRPNILAGPELESLSLSRDRARAGDPVVIEAQISGEIEGSYTLIEGPDDQMEMPMVDFDSNGIYTAWWETGSWTPGDYTIGVELEGKYGERRSRAVPFHLDPRG